MILRSPDFGNTVTVDTGVVNGRTQDGELMQMYDPQWGHEDSFTVTFSALSEEQRWELDNFYKNFIGEQITFVDHENRTWLGFITTKMVFRQMGRGCMWQASFGFIGVLQ